MPSRRGAWHALPSSRWPPPARRYATARSTSTRSTDHAWPSTSAPRLAAPPMSRSRSRALWPTAGGEACGILVLEQLEHARDRGARIYAELAGFGATEDAYHLTAPAPGGEYAALAITRAIEDAELRPADVDHISAHGTGTPLND